MQRTDEFEIGRGRRQREDAFSLSRSWQRGYSSDRLTAGYIKNCYSNSPQAVYKIISFGRGISAKKMMEYVNQREGIDQTFYTESAEILKGQEDINELYKEWSSEFRKKGSGRGEQRHVTHVLLSADVSPSKRNANQVLDAARETLFEEFGINGFEYTYVLHTDTNHPHVHAIIKNYNRVTNRKLRQDRHDLFRIRKDFAKCLNSRGLTKHISTLVRDRPETFQLVLKSLHSIQGQKERMDATLDQCQFVRRKTQMVAQAEKAPESKHHYQNAKIDFNNDNTKYLQITTNKQGNQFEKILKRIALSIGSQDFNISINENATINIRDIQSFSDQQKNEIKQLFDTMVLSQAEKQKVALAKKTKDVLPTYRSAIKRTDQTIRWVKRSKLSIFQKRQILEPLRMIKQQLLTGYDVKQIQDASVLVNAQLGIDAAKELQQFQQESKKKPFAIEFLRRKNSLEAYLKNQKSDVKKKINFYRSQNDKEMVDLLRGMVYKRAYDQIIQTQTRVRDLTANRFNLS